MAAYLYRMPSGIPGAISRESQCKIEPGVSDPTLPFTAYGRFGKVVNGRFVPVTTGDAAAAVYGLLIRPYPTTGGSVNEPVGTAVPAPPNRIHDVMVAGYATIVVNSGTAAMNNPVYIRIAAATSSKPLGGIEAAADGANTIQVPLARFMGGADAGGNAEVAFNV